MVRISQCLQKINVYHLHTIFYDSIIILMNNILLLVLFLVIFFIGSLVGIHVFTDYQDLLYKVTSYYGLIALVGAIIGIGTSKKWGGMNSAIGRCLGFFSGGLLAQVFGQVVYTVSIDILKIEVPYPSLGDIGFFGSIPLYIMGILSLSQAIGFKLRLKDFKNKLFVVIIPLVMLLVSYFIFLSGYEFDWSRSVAIFLDFGYPLGQSLYISIALVVFVLSNKSLGGMMRKSVLLLLLALATQYVADFSFLYLVSRGLWQPASFTDAFYILSYALMSLAIIEIRSISQKINV